MLRRKTSVFITTWKTEDSKKSFLWIVIPSASKKQTEIITGGSGLFWKYISLWKWLNRIKGFLRSDAWLAPCTQVGSYFGPYLITQRKPRWTRPIALGHTILVEVTSERKLMEKINCGRNGKGVFKPFSFPAPEWACSNGLTTSHTAPWVGSPPHFSLCLFHWNIFYSLSF